MGCPPWQRHDLGLATDPQVAHVQPPIALQLDDHREALRRTQPLAAVLHLGQRTWRRALADAYAIADAAYPSVQQLAGQASSTTSTGVPGRRWPRLFSVMSALIHRSWMAIKVITGLPAPT